MSRSRRRKRRLALLAMEKRLPPGTSPGTIQTDPDAPRPHMRVFAFGPDGVDEREVSDMAPVAALRARWPVLWLNVDGLGDAATIEAIGREFNLHRLALEDVVNVHQRAKLENYGSNLFFVARMPEPGERMDTDQLSLFLGKGFVVTFQERAGDCFDPVRERLRRGGPIRGRGADYLAYSLIDAVVDSWFPVLERHGERLEELEEEILSNPGRGTLGVIHELRRDLMALRRCVWPLRDVLGVLYRDPNPLVGDEARLYLRDCYDHTVQVIDLVENGREIAAELTDAYLASINNRMNEVMKVLAVIATIFLPISFIASVYGMNFHTDKSPWNMPELTWWMGYPFSLGLMALTVAAMLFFFWRRGWLKSDASWRRTEGPPK